MLARLRLVARFLILLLPTFSAVADLCDEKKVAAFYDVYKVDSSKVKWETVRDKACKQKSDNGKFSASFVADGVPVMGTADYQKLSKACWDDQRNYFEDNKLSLTYLYASPDVKKLLAQECFGGAMGLVTQTPNGSISISIFARSGEDVGVYAASGLKLSDEHVATIKKDIARGAKIPPRGATVLLHRTNYREFVATLPLMANNLPMQDLEVFVPGATYEELHYDVVPGKGGNEMFFGCRWRGQNLEMGIDGRPIGLDSFSRENLREKYCQLKHGKALRNMPGEDKLEVVRDDWRTDGVLLEADGYVWFDCYRNGAKVGRSQCLFAKTVGPPATNLCDQEIGRRAQCVSDHPEFVVSEHERLDKGKRDTKRR